MARAKLYSGPEDVRIKRALCIVAHPDDIEFYCAGTVLKLTQRGVTVDFVLATSGDKGSANPSISSDELGRQREAEQESAARVLGAGEVEFLRHPDAELEETLALRREFCRAIRRARPDLLLTFDPSPAYRYHPDHRIVGRVALDAAWPAARDRLTFADTGPPHETAEAWCFAGSASDLEVDVSDQLETKIRARLEHRSQTLNPGQLRHRWRAIGRSERFHRVDLR